MSKRLRWVKVTGLPIGEPLFDGAYAQGHKLWCGDWLNEKCSIVADALNNYLQNCAEYYRVLETSADGQTAEVLLFTDSSMTDDAISGLIKALWERTVDAPAVLKRWDAVLQSFFVYHGGTYADVRGGYMC